MAVALRTVLAVLAIVAGVAILGVGVDAAATAAKPGYHHAVSPAADTDRIQRVANDSSVRAVYDYQTLSAEAQRAFRAALDAEDGEATVRGAADRPPEFEYGDTGALGEGQFFVRYEGDYYVLRTSGAQLSGWVAAVPPLFVAALVGGSAITAGVLGFVGYDPLRSVTTLAGTGVPTVAVAGGVLGELRAVAFTGVVAGSVTWYVLGSLWRED